MKNSTDEEIVESENDEYFDRTDEESISEEFDDSSEAL